jgi:hypothetical protein
MHRQSGQANLTTILLVVGTIVAAIWIWKHLSADTQDAFVEHAVPLLAVGAAAAAGVSVVIAKIRARIARRRTRERLIGRFERETAPEKRLDLAFALIELNGYSVSGLEGVAPAMKELFLQTMKTAVGDKQHRIRGMAASHLGVLQDASVVAVLLKALEDDHAYVRGCAALGLGRLRAREAMERLKKVMEDDWDQTVRSRAREAVERMG